METIAQLQTKLEATGTPYVLATVVAVRGSVSAKLGSQAVISAEGKNLLGWVGGGCAESYTIEQSLEALKEGQARTIVADLDDEVFGLGMPCGGVMELFLDPRTPPELISLPISETEFAKSLCSWLGISPIYSLEKKDSFAEQALLVAQSLAHHRGKTFRALQEVKGVYPRQSSHPTHMLEAPFSELVVLGAGRISESLCYIADGLGWPTVAYGLELNPSLYPTGTRVRKAEADYKGFSVSRGSAVLVASHHKGDPEFLERSLDHGAAWVGLVASSKRSKIVFEHLKHRGWSEGDLALVAAPAGLDLGARGPKEIALSVVAELIQKFSLR